MKAVTTIAAAVLAALTATAEAGVTRDLPYPTGTPSADQVAAQVYFVNHFYALDNFSIVEDGNNVTVLISRAAGSEPTTNTVVRHLNNAYKDGEIKAKDLAIFQSGKLKGTGMLIIDFTDDSKSQSYSIWLPALRKIRRFAQPAHDDAWGGTDFTFGDVTLRKPEHETHELLGTETFGDCLGAMEIPAGQRNKYMENLPAASCDHKGRQVYKLKSGQPRQESWYEYRVSYVDTKTFADYRTEYFKDGKKIKVIDRDWGSFDMQDPRAMYWKYWYGKNLDTNHETWAVIPKSIVRPNDKLEESLWSEATLSRISR